MSPQARRRAARSPIWSPGWSLTRLVATVSCVALVLALAAGTLVLTTLAQVATARQQQDLARSARHTLGAVLTGYLDEETGLRGYLATGEDQFLEPLTTAETALPALQDTLRRQAGALGVPDGLLTAPLDTHARWSAWAQRERARRQAGDPTVAAALDQTLAGKQLFDTLRRQVDALDAWLSERERRHRDRFDTLDRRLQASVAVSLAVLVAGLAGGYLFLRRTVTAPVARLARASRAVAHGDLDARLPTGGAPEVDALAGDVADMRDRLTADLGRTRQALEALAQADPALAALQRELSADAPPGPSAWAGLSVEVRAEAAEGVLAGDWCDVFEVTTRELAVVIGDVSGHGAASAVFALRLKHTLRTALHVTASPAQALRVLAARSADTDPEMFATLFVGLLDLVGARLTYVNAGHPPGLLQTPDGRWQELAATGPLLSPVLVDAEWTERAVDFVPGQRLLLYTDGVLEARDPGGREFGLEGVRRSLAQVRDRRAGLVDAVEAAAVRHSRFRARADDHTLLLLSRATGPA
ncbi:PP2C family protein-serine/threonine phosphatase [Kineococcus rhizosphaerae]|uniref:HAMP domain-containing protein n=1 Tax=Kineococcus rhizosphaerae TaxID=559628 RepID=A0A2T0RAN3_9ACTN|nr:SpoIIE family protein phosphatase [Kineococcus rhizosphaerae]PRY18226.1 HAMP domain-containing protein [Kineococcus rhizosphaerae]